MSDARGEGAPEVGQVLEIEAGPEIVRNERRWLARNMARIAKAAIATIMNVARMGAAIAAAIQASEEIDFLRQCRDLKQRRVCRKALRVDSGSVFISRRAAPLMHSQLLNFCQIEIESTITPVAPSAVGKTQRYVRCTVQLDVVQHNRDAVPRQHNILLHVVGTHNVCHRFGRQCVLWQIAAGATVRDNNWIGTFHEGLLGTSSTAE